MNRSNLFREAAAFLLFILVIQQGEARYQPDWDSLDSRPLPSWYDDGKIGIFIHWGVFSVPAYSSEWFWWQWKGQPTLAVVEYMQSNYRPDFTYADFAPMFRAEFYNPDKWAALFKKAGAKYIVLVSKHHEGFTNWPSNYSWNWNAMDVGPKRDLVGDLGQAIRKSTDIKFGLYHSMFEWFHPLFLKDQANGFHTQEYVKAKTMPELYEIVNKYKPDVVWSDGEWMAADAYWNSKEFIAWLYNDSPVKDTVAVNDRWGNNTRCKHGGFWDCADRFKPGQLLPRKWENCMTIDRYSWGYRADARLSDYYTIEDLLKELIITVSLGGNLLINVGPTSYGEIAPIFQERLTQMGDWLEVNGEAIYKTHVWTHQNDSQAKDVWYTAKNVSASKNVVYALLPSWPTTANLALADPVPSDTTVVTLLGYPEPLKWSMTAQGKGMDIVMPLLPYNKMPCKWAWALKLEGLKNQKALPSPQSFSKHFEAIAMRRERGMLRSV
ncbi:hypothetical protein RRG08_059408 [Elysia crispata]|uniref:alpha-L-fucosidase n=1 Tax=Elysia crispata TaxID=231223 RepID=A0AAE1D861_9GAST|nr:hypothetical protein RRG08_059408 [Elysia crispata]